MSSQNDTTDTTTGEGFCSGNLHNSTIHVLNCDQCQRETRRVARHIPDPDHPGCEICSECGRDSGVLCGCGITVTELPALTQEDIDRFAWEDAVDGKVTPVTVTEEAELSDIVTRLMALRDRIDTSGHSYADVISEDIGEAIGNVCDARDAVAEIITGDLPNLNS